MGVRAIVRRKTIAQVKRGMKDLQRQGYVPVMPEPVLDVGNFYYLDQDYYVMVMEHPTRKATGKKW